MIITSAWRGVARATSNPKRDQSYFAAAVLIISMAQQLVPNTNGHNELERAQLITSSNLLITIPPPATGCTSPGKTPAPPSSLPVGARLSSILFISLSMNISFLFSPFGEFRGALLPLQCPRFMSIQKPHKKNKEKNYYLKKSTHPNLFYHHCPGI